MASRHPAAEHLSGSHALRSYPLSSSLPIGRQSPPIPEPVARVAAIMSTFRARWSLCGGWAVDAWLGAQSRDHHDVDITVFHDKQRTLFDHLVGWQLIAHDPNVPGDTQNLWDGRRLDLPAHIHARADDGFNLEVLLNERSGSDWVLSRKPSITLPLSQGARQSAWGLPTLVPAAILFYKATAYFGDPDVKERPHDELDFLALLPQLTAQQHFWLWGAISLIHPGHPWLP